MKVISRSRLYGGKENKTKTSITVSRNTKLQLKITETISKNRCVFTLNHF